MVSVRDSVVLAIVVFCLSVIPLTQPRVGRAEDPITSIYTDLTPGACKTIRIDKEGGGSTQSCGGVGGYKLLVEDSDNRMSVTVVDPRGQKHPLKFWDVITGSFSVLGKKAEWRIVRRQGRAVPVALIVRVDANESLETNRVTSYLAVAKITPQSVCVIDKIGPIQNANLNAREAADLSATRPCLER